jgi:hypothetical protein
LDHIQSRMTKSMLSENSLPDQISMNQHMRASELQSSLNESMLSVSRQSSLLRAPSIGVYKFNRTSLVPQSRLRRSRKKSMFRSWGFSAFYPTLLAVRSHTAINISFLSHAVEFIIQTLLVFCLLIQVNLILMI